MRDNFEFFVIIICVAILTNKRFKFTKGQPKQSQTICKIQTCSLVYIAIVYIKPSKELFLASVKARGSSFSVNSKVKLLAYFDQPLTVL